jgi:hypothetical protein
MLFNAVQCRFHLPKINPVIQIGTLHHFFRSAMRHLEEHSPEKEQ